MRSSAGAFKRAPADHGVIVPTGRRTGSARANSQEHAAIRTFDATAGARVDTAKCADARSVDQRVDRSAQVEGVLLEALRAAAAAGQWDMVAQLARELRRRLQVQIVDRTALLADEL